MVRFRKNIIFWLVIGIIIAIGSPGYGDETGPLPSKSTTRKKFQLQFPSDWKIDTGEEDYDPDHLFTIDGPGSAMVTFIIKDGLTDIEENLQKYVSIFKEVLGTQTSSRFDWYGIYFGRGAELKGKRAGQNAVVKIFSLGENTFSVTIIQSYAVKDLKSAREGFTLIEKSFKLLTGK